MLRKLLQFGDSPDGAFLFTPFQEEEEYPDEVVPNMLGYNGNDGSFRYMGFNQSRKPEKRITKRFNLYSAELLDALSSNPKEATGKLLDYMYRTLRGGVKKLYVLMEDGTVRWTWAEAITVPYNAVFSSSDKWHPVVVDFLMQDPHFYTIADNATFYFELPSWQQLVDACATFDFESPSYLLQKDTTLFPVPECTHTGIIIRDDSLAGFVGVGGECSIAECSVDPCIGHVGDLYSLEGDGTIDICVEGSAGAGIVSISFMEGWANPTIMNTANGNTLEYQGNLGAGEYLTIDLSSALTGDIEDYTIDTNIPGFDINDIVVNNNGHFDLEIGTNTLTITGVTPVADFSLFGINWANKYHN